MNAASRRALADEAIEATAAAWLAQEDDLSPAQAEEFGRWRAADARHAAAVDRLRQTHHLLGNLPRLRQQPALLQKLEPLTTRPPLIRFRPMTALAGLAAAIVVGLVVWQESPRADSTVQVHTTALHGYERAMLPDGSVVELNANTALEVRFTATERLVHLVRGEAHFEVAKNPTRPFVVSAGHIRVRAVGTAFNVRLDPSRVDVLVTEGKVALARVDRAPAATTGSMLDAGDTTTLVAGQRATLKTSPQTPAASIETVAPAVVSETLAWQAPRLVFADTPLAEVVARFNVRNRIQLVIGDPQIARRPVGGNFRADYVEAFVRLLEATGDISAEHPDADHIVLRPARR